MVKLAGRYVMDDAATRGEVSDESEPVASLFHPGRPRSRIHARRHTREQRAPDNELPHPPHLGESGGILERRIPIRAQPPINLDAAILEPAGGRDGRPNAIVVLERNPKRTARGHGLGEMHPKPGREKRVSLESGLGELPRPLVEPLSPEALLRVRLLWVVNLAGPQRCELPRDEPLSPRSPMRAREPPSPEVIKAGILRRAPLDEQIPLAGLERGESRLPAAKHQRGREAMSGRNEEELRLH